MCTTSTPPRYIQCTGKPKSGCGPGCMPRTRAYQSRVASISSAATRKCSMCERGMHQYITKEERMDFADSKRLTAAGARKMMTTAIARAQEAGIAVTVAIADAGGHLLLLERMEGGRFHTVHSATTKAVCAASNRRPTSAKGAQGQPLDTAHALGLALAAGPERWTAMEGGCPVIVGGECIGGVGVAGGSWEFDARLAREAVESIGASAQ